LEYKQAIAGTLNVQIVVFVLIWKKPKMFYRKNQGGNAFDKKT
jgi:hypothetical protein